MFRKSPILAFAHLLVACALYAPASSTVAGRIPRIEVELSEQEWLKIRAAVAYPRNDVKPRHSVAFRTRTNQPWLYTATVESTYYEQGRGYRRFYSTSCQKQDEVWTCSRPRDMLLLSDDVPVFIGKDVVPADVVEIADVVGGHPNTGWRQGSRFSVVKLVEVQVRESTYYAVIRQRDPLCWSTLRLVRSMEGVFIVLDDRPPPTKCA